MKTTNYKQLREQIEKTYRADIDALDRVQALEAAMADDAKTPAKQNKRVTTQKSDRNGGAGKGAIIKAVLEIVGKLQSPFTGKDVLDALAAKHPDGDFKSTSVKQAIASLVEQKELALVVRGKGRSPSTFKRI